MTAATNIKTFTALNTSYGNKTMNKGVTTWCKINKLMYFPLSENTSTENMGKFQTLNKYKTKVGLCAPSANLTRNPQRYVICRHHDTQ